MAMAILLALYRTAVPLQARLSAELARGIMTAISSDEGGNADIGGCAELKWNEKAVLLELPGEVATHLPKAFLCGQDESCKSHHQSTPKVGDNLEFPPS
jgi:hypothetical protein